MPAGVPIGRGGLAPRGGLRRRKERSKAHATGSPRPLSPPPPAADWPRGPRRLQLLPARERGSFHVPRTSSFEDCLPLPLGGGIRLLEIPDRAPGRLAGGGR